MVCENSDFRYEVLDLDSPFDIQMIQEFLEPLGFNFDRKTVDYTMVLYNLNGDIIGSGSLMNQILKFVAVAPKFRETTAFADVVKHLTTLALEKNKTSFVFTKPENAVKFQSIGYNELASAPPVYSLLEFGYEGINQYKNYLKKLKRPIEGNQIASVVVNCNPFTNGHLFLIEKASRENDLVYLFVVEEDGSVFDFETRWMLIEKGITHLHNVVMVKGGNYIVSKATFPSYFLKNENVDIVTRKQTELDVSVFAKHIAPVLEIKRRYVGTENYCNTTAQYNQSMKNILGKQGIEVIEVERKYVTDKDNYISASKVRKAIKEDDLGLVSDFLPETTLEFLESEESLKIREAIKNNNARH